ncbi:MAG: hypothetical protein HQK60_01770 [Deltaproteobacteria bacterium]|nr:hypothetical protein [Deltaproteobacteria bacterium]
MMNVQAIRQIHNQIRPLTGFTAGLRNGGDHWRLRCNRPDFFNSYFVLEVTEPGQWAVTESNNIKDAELADLTNRLKVILN